MVAEKNMFKTKIISYCHSMMRELLVRFMVAVYYMAVYIQLTSSIFEHG